jgi:hypothetical protein
VPLRLPVAVPHLPEPARRVRSVSATQFAPARVQLPSRLRLLLRLSRNRSCATQMKKPDVTEPVIGRAFTRPVWLIQATLAARVFVLQYGFRLRGGGPIRIRIQVDGGLCRSAKRSAFPLAAPSTVLVHSRGLPKARQFAAPCAVRGHKILATHVLFEYRGIAVSRSAGLPPGVYPRPPSERLVPSSTHKTGYIGDREITSDDGREMA